jgi:hypothetical protein
MAKLDLLRKLIREEVRAAIQEQLSEILKEAITVNKSSRVEVQETFKPSKPVIPGTLNTRPARPQYMPQLAPDNPLNNLLMETAQSMTDQDIGSLNYDSSNAMEFGGNGMYQPETQVVSTVDEMFASARPSSNMDMVEINAVPDFTGLMEKLRANGEI